LKTKFKNETVDAELVEGSKGIVDVVVDGEKIFSKWDSGRFPIYGEIPKLIVAGR
jgi:hypothetical protein